MTEVMLPISMYPSAAASSDRPPPYMPKPAPANTPVEEPFSDSGSIPARSRASHAVSSSTRCWGSMVSASRGLIPKNCGSNSAAS
ncbi:hypothetical protein Kisp01_35990 [Kineosporia sp. NBRC 101677]|nr:hypothetical protein Kisp01_35990 [Kineosporia sp. NBRC 101677]